MPNSLGILALLPRSVRSRTLRTESTNKPLQAIRYAVEVWHVDILSMSFGYESMVEVIDDALKFAGDHKVLLIAAASNVGSNTAYSRRWPSERDNVISVRAAEGRGFEWEGNPPPDSYDYNFSTLGVMVPVWVSAERQRPVGANLQNWNVNCNADCGCYRCLCPRICSDD
jgi:hypothetical protein